MYIMIYIFLIETKTVLLQENIITQHENYERLFLSLDVTNLKVCSLAAFYPTAIIIVALT